MPVDHTMRERHDCIVCGRTYHIYVSYDEHGDYLTCSAPDPASRVLPHPDRPIVVCISHPGREVAAALADVMAEAEEHDHDGEAGHPGHHH